METDKLLLYQNKIYTFLCEKYSARDLRDLGKHFELTLDQQTQSREEMAKLLLQKIVLENRLFALFALMTRYVKYRKEGCKDLIRFCAEIAPVPNAIQRPTIDISVSSFSQTNKSTPAMIITKKDDIIFRKNMKAVIIGIGKDLYGNENGSSCEKDANAIANFLRENWKIKEENLLLLTGYVTGSEARKALKTLCEKACPEDCILFYFSGYGIVLNQNGYLMTSDSYIHIHTVRNGLSFIYINELLRKCKAKIKLRIFDANYAGQHLEELALPQTNTLTPFEEAELYREITDIQSKQILINGHGTITFTACDASQKSYESQYLGHSYFTYFLLQALREKQARNQKFGIYMEDIKVYTCRKVTETLLRAGILQVPQYQCEITGNLLME